MKLLSAISWALLGIEGLVSALPRQSGHRAAQLLSRSSNSTATNFPLYYFDQLIDHFPQSSRYAPHVNGTFQQRYYVEDSFYKAGGPVILHFGGEGPIDDGTALDGDSVLSQSIVKLLAQKFGGIAIVLENRYYGSSCPFNSSTTDQLRYLTTEQVIADFAYFARNVKLPGGENITAPGTPWITHGTSYAGALAAFTLKTYGDTFYGGISSSGVIHAQLDFPEWYDPVQLLAPQDCVASVNNIVDKIDALVEANQTSAIQRLKEVFGLESLTDIRDFAQTIAFPIGGPFEYPTWSFQQINWNPELGHEDFFYFCDNVTNINAPANNTSIDQEFASYTNGQPWKNLGNYAAYIKQVVLPLCASGDYNNGDCFGTQNQDYWANSTTSAVRSYLYTTCTEFGIYQAARPQGQKSLISRVIDTNYTQEWCNWAFPPGKYNTIPSTPDLDRWNSYGDLNLTADRLLFIDGTTDVFRDLCYHSNYAPQRYWTDLQPEHLINGAIHGWDLLALDDPYAEPQFIRETTLLELRTVESWLRDFSSWQPVSS